MSAQAVEAVLDAYIGAWNSDAGPARDALLEAALAEDGAFSGPTGTFRGWASIAGLIDAMRARMPGGSVTRTGPATLAEDGVIRFGWRVRRADGDVLMEGVDEVELAGDGRIALVRMRAGATT